MPLHHVPTHAPIGSQRALQIYRISWLQGSQARTAQRLRHGIDAEPVLTSFRNSQTCTINGDALLHNRILQDAMSLNDKASWFDAQQGSHFFNNACKHAV